MMMMMTHEQNKMSLDEDVNLEAFIEARDDLSGADIRVFHSFILSLFSLHSLFAWRLV